MRRWSGGDGGSRGRSDGENGSGIRWDRRGYVEPMAALAAVSVIALALSLYAGAFEANLPEPVDRSVAQPTVDRVEREATTGGVVRPSRLSGARAVGPDGYRTNVSLVADGRQWQVGPDRPPSADNASRRVSVRIEPGRVDPGRLQVTVWT